MTPIELESLFTQVCMELGVTAREVRWGTAHVTSAGRAWAQYSVSLARSLFMFKAWQNGAGARETALMLRIADRNVRRWFRDFRARATPGTKERGAA